MQAATSHESQEQVGTLATFLIVRHGQTAWNKDERCRGRTDLPLDETGLALAGAIARRITAAYRPTAVYASPLLRATATRLPRPG